MCTVRAFTVDVGLGELDETWRQDFGHSADSGRDDEQAGAGGLEDADAERLGQRGVEEDLCAREELRAKTGQSLNQ